MTFLKKVSIGSYILLGAVILSIVGLIAGISCATEEFPVSSLPMIITFTIVSILLIGGVIYTATVFGDKMWVTAILLAVVLFLSLCVYYMFVGRIDLMGTLWFSVLDVGYKPAEEALATGTVSLVFYLLAAFAVAASGFFKLSKKTD